MNFPILLPMTKTLVAGGAVRPDDQIVFRNPYNTPMIVEQLNFLVLGTFQDPKQSKIRLKINGQYIVNDFVPFPLLCPRIDYNENRQGNRVFSTYWRPVKPLWLDAKEDISVELLLDPNDSYVGTQATETVTVSLAGKSVDFRPTERYMPFNAVWNVPITSLIISSTSSLQSPDSALFNGINDPVYITRMLSDYGKWAARSDAPLNTQEDFFLLQTRISHSNGSYIVKDPIRLFELFSGWGRNLDTRFVMQPKEFITIAP